MYVDADGADRAFIEPEQQGVMAGRQFVGVLDRIFLRLEQHVAADAVIRLPFVGRCRRTQAIAAGVFAPLHACSIGAGAAESKRITRMILPARRPMPYRMARETSRLEADNGVERASRN